MKIEISEKGINYFINEIGTEEGSKVRFYTQIYGTSPIQPGYALAFTLDDDLSNAAVHTVEKGITFFIGEADLWFFNGHDLFIDYNETNDELEYNYVKPQ